MIVCIIQARMGSSRFPGKVMTKIDGKPIIQVLAERLKKSKLLDAIVIATSKKKENNVLDKFCKKKRILFFRGSESDVLSRYCNCAAKFEAKTIVRITSDCPLIDPEVVDKIVSFFLKKNFDYVSNTTPSLSSTWPNGSDVEVFSYEALKKLNKKKLNKFHREHVTTFFYKSKKFKSHQIKNNYDWSNYRYTMDYPEDLTVIKKIFGHLKRKKKFGYLPQIISILKQDKKIFY